MSTIAMIELILTLTAARLSGWPILGRGMEPSPGPVRDRLANESSNPLVLTAEPALFLGSAWEQGDP